MRWDLFCRVIDNHGDLGVCWRLAADLGSRGQRVRLWVDDASALRWMAPGGAPGVAVFGWDLALAPPTGAHGEAGEPAGAADVVVEAFGCELPEPVLARMALARPAWINLEYLSAEAYVERSHGLRSPVQYGPGAGLDKWFFYPGFTAATGGLLRESALTARLRHDAAAGAWAPRAWPLDPRARRLHVFCYPCDRLAPLVAQWAGPVELAGACGASLTGPRLARLPWCDQPAFDAWLGRGDLNIVRGEDSFVRAQWAGRPFVWHVYPQHDHAHHAKLEAFLDRYLDGAPGDFAAALRRLWRGWNGLQPWPGGWPDDGPDPAAWLRHAAAWRARLLAQDDLVTQLLRFVVGRRAAA